MLSANHVYLGTLPDSHTGAVGDWMMQFVYMGNRMEPSDIVDIHMTMQFFDEEMHDTPCIAFTVSEFTVPEIELALLLPAGKRGKANAEEAVIKSPNNHSVKVSSAPLAADEDGWLRTSFTNTKDDHQCGIYLPGFNLYS